MFEVAVGQEIVAAGFDVEPQVKIGRWHVDFLVVGTRVVIEADGSFWHSSDKVKERDRRKVRDLNNKNYVVLRIDELDFYKRRGGTLKPLLTLMSAVDAGVST